MSQQDPEPSPSPGGPLSEADSRLWAMLGHLSGVLLSFVGPLVVWLVFRERSAAVDDQGKEALNFQITVLVGYVVAAVLAGVTLGLLSFLPFLVWVVNIIFCVLGGVAANRGERYRYPFAWRPVT